MRAIAAGCLAVGLVATACSGPAENTAGDTAEDPVAPASARPSAPSGASPSPSARSTSNAPAAPPEVPQPPRTADDRRGRVTFARYVLQAWIHALNTNDARPLLDVSGDRPCTGCELLAGELEQRAEEGWTVALQDVRVSGAEVTTEGARSRALLSVAIPASSTFHDDGTFRSTNPAHPRSTFEVTMRRERDRFRLVGFALY